MKIAITGITSGVGRRFAELALEAGHRLCGLARRPDRDDARQLSRQGVELIGGDLLDERALGQLCRSSDAVVHLAAHVGDWGPREQFERVNVGGTEKVLAAASKAGVRRLLHMSSVAVYGRPRNGRITEQMPRTKTGVPYDDSKCDSEALVFERGPGLGLEVTALRPPVIYGPYDRNFIPRSLRLLRQGRMMLINGGRVPLNVVWVDHLVQLALLALDKPEAIGEAFNVTDSLGEPPPSVREVSETIAKAAGLPPPTRTVPYPIAFAFAHVVNAAYKLVRAENPPPISPFVVRLMMLDIIYDGSKAARVLGWKPQTQALEGIARFARELSRADA